MIEDLNSINKTWKRTYTLACVIAAIYYSAIQAQRYAKNEDMSIIDFKQLNQNANDIYPDITFCLIGTNFNNRIEKFKVSDLEFSDVLKGETFEYVSSNLILNNSEAYFKELKDIISFASFKTTGDTKIIIHDSDHVNQKEDNFEKYFDINYKDPKKFCFTRSSKHDDDKRSIRLRDDLEMKVTSRDTVFRIYLYYPGQFMRNIELPTAESKPKSPESKKNEEMKLTIQGITTLRRRSRASNPCDDENKKDDHQIVKFITRDFNCIPSYWNSTFQRHLDNQSIKICEKSEEYKYIYRNIESVSNSMSNFKMPCNSMVVSTGVVTESVQKPKDTKMTTSIVYSTSQYQEIINVRDFDFDSMFSAMGGFVGIFLGHSLLQLSDVIDLSTLKKIRRFFSNWKH